MNFLGVYLFEYRGVVWYCVFTKFSYLVSVRCFGWGRFSFRILRTVFPSITSFRGITSFVFLFERQPRAANISPALISLSNCLISSFTSDFLCFGCLILRAFASAKSSFNKPCFQKIMRRLSVLEFDPFVSDLVFWEQQM